MGSINGNNSTTTTTTTTNATTTTTAIQQKRDRIFSELSDLIPLGENTPIKQNSKTFYSHNNASIHYNYPKLSVPLDDETFEIMADEMTMGPTCTQHQQQQQHDPTRKDDVIKRSYRIMTYMVQDMQEAQNFLINKFGNQDKFSDILYTRNLINPTRAGLLVKRIFLAYRQLVAFYQEELDMVVTLGSKGGHDDKKHEQQTQKIQPHLPHLNQTLRVLLLAFPTQVIGASFRGGEKGFEQWLEPMLQLHQLLVVTWTIMICKGENENEGECEGEHLSRIASLIRGEQQGAIDEDMSFLLESPARQREFSPLDIVRDILILGCTGIRKYASSLPTSSIIPQTQQIHHTQQALSLQNKILINAGHRRKFVNGLIKWGGLEHFVSIIYKNKTCAQDIMEALLEIVDALLYHDDLFSSNNNGGNMDQSGANAKNGKGAQQWETVGEEVLLAQLASPRVIHGLFEGLDRSQQKLRHNNHDGYGSEQEYIETISWALLGVFELATGKKKQQVQPQDPPHVLGKEEDGAGSGSVECKMTDHDRLLCGMVDNLMIKEGITDKLHAAMCQEMKSLVNVMDVYLQGHLAMKKDQGDGHPDPSENRQDNYSSTRDAVTHPGGNVIYKPFTSTRLELLTLFTNLVSYKCYAVSKCEHNSTIEALDALMELPLPFEPLGETEIDCANQPGVVYNPWPGICDLLFNYPENNMFHVQFYRLIHTLCITNHEPTLKLVVQKCKLLSRALKVCCSQDRPCSTRGILLQCLNALRLHSESLSPNSFLRHYLESHDGWKAMKDEIKRMTMEQEQRGGGIAVPNVMGDTSVATSVSDVDIGLGSPLAISLGFPVHIKPYNMTEKDESITNNDGSDAISSIANKKKKKPKKKKSKK